MNVPKIIHHIAPLDKERWHPIWDYCYPTWKERFSNFEHRLWNDHTDIDTLVRNFYPDYWQLYQDLPTHINRIDFARFCILHKYGGIYADMDVYCYKNFYDEINAELQIVEAPYGVEFLENALMVSIPNHQFWIDCMDLSKKQFYEVVSKKNIDLQFFNNIATQHILTTLSGPNLVCRTWRKWVNRGVKTLPGILYNNHGMSYHPEYRTRHMLTGMWGKEAIENLKKHSDEGSFKKFLEKQFLTECKKYSNLNIDSLKNFNFYYDYTNGGMKTFFNLDFLRSDVDNPENFNYE